MTQRSSARFRSRSRRVAGLAASSLAALVAIGASACGTTPAVADPAQITPGAPIVGACREMASRCHPYDTGEGIAHDCHEVGHNAVGGDAECTKKHPACLAACPPRGDAGHPDASGDAARDSNPPIDGSDAASDVTPPSPCATYCACLSSVCSNVAGYPYTAEAACLTRCQTLQPAELSCFTGFCLEASAAPSGLKPHKCEHAWGKLGLEEC